MSLPSGPPASPTPASPTPAVPQAGGAPAGAAPTLDGPQAPAPPARTGYGVVLRNRLFLLVWAAQVLSQSAQNVVNYALVV